jgi:hypothetical protein
MFWKAAAIVSAFLVTNTVGEEEMTGLDYCSESEKSTFVANQTYRRIFQDCVDPAASDLSAIRTCVNNLFGETTVGADCAQCWHVLLAGINRLPPSNLEACLDDPTSATCVDGEAFHEILATFETCSGVDPIIDDVAAAASSGTDSASIRFAMIATPILFITLMIC